MKKNYLKEKIETLEDVLNVEENGLCIWVALEVGERNYIVMDVENQPKIVPVKINRYGKNWKTHTD